MEKDDFYLSILIGIISGLIVLLGQSISINIKNTSLKLGLMIITPFILFVIFIKIFEWRMKNKK